MSTAAPGLLSSLRGASADRVVRADLATRLLAMLMLCAVAVRPWVVEAVGRDQAPPDAQSAAEPAETSPFRGREILAAGYAGAPFYYRSDVHLVQPGGTDVTLKRLGWDGDALYFPVDGGIRSVEWWGSFGFMVDFLHNKAIARLGRGAHGRRLSNPVVEEVAASGTIAGKPAPARIKLTDLFERFEFTHGHNMLMLTPMLRLPSIRPGVRPYVGVGAGFALPHVEVWSPGAGREYRTNEYQYGGGVAQLVAGVELRVGRWSYFVEYKFSYASIAGALTGEESWKNFNMPGDLVRQLLRWWRREEPKFGRFSTTLAAHQIVGGAGYWGRWGKNAR